MLSFIFILVKITTPEKEAELRKASKYGDIDYVQVLLQSGTNVNAPGMDPLLYPQWTALHYAGESKHF